MAYSVNFINNLSVDYFRPKKYLKNILNLNRTTIFYSKWGLMT